MNSSERFCQYGHAICQGHISLKMHLIDILLNGEKTLKSRSFLYEFSCVAIASIDQ